MLSRLSRSWPRPRPSPNPSPSPHACPTYFPESCSSSSGASSRTRGGPQPLPQPRPDSSTLEKSAGARARATGGIAFQEGRGSGTWSLLAFRYCRREIFREFQEAPFGRSWISGSEARSRVFHGSLSFHCRTLRTEGCDSPTPPSPSHLLPLFSHWRARQRSMTGLSSERKGRSHPAATNN